MEIYFLGNYQKVLRVKETIVSGWYYGLVGLVPMASFPRLEIQKRVLNK